MPTLRPILLLLSLAAATAAGTPAAAAAATRTCADSTGYTLATSGQDRIFERVVRRNPPQSDTSTIYACREAYRGVKIRRLTTVAKSEYGDRVSSVHYAGSRYVLLRIARVSLDSQYYDLELYNVRTGRKVVSETTGDNPPYDAPVVTEQGGFAYLDASESLIGLDQHGRRTLAVGRPTAPAPTITELASVGSRIYWMADGAPASTVLDGRAKN